jgi:hypothetical protein
MKWFLIAGVALMAILVGVMGAVNVATNEAAKESHIDTATGTLVDLKGSPVQAKTLFSFTSLFELPSFDIATLAQVRQLTLIMVGGTKVSFSISDAVKHDGDRMVTFMTSSGGKIVVDGVTKIARATVAGACYLVDGTVDEVAALGSLAGRKLNSNNGDDYHYKRAGDEATRRMPRLYTKEDFFTERRGFVKGGRKLGTARDGTAPQKGFGG